MVDRPSGTVTFLITDIEGSTRRWESAPDVMRAALAGHDDVLRSAIEARGGWLFKHTGDGVCAAFSSAPDAVAAAIDAQRVLGACRSVRGSEPGRPSSAAATSGQALPGATRTERLRRCG